MAEHPRYRTTQFPKYTYREFPKIIKFEDGTKVKVADRAEELRARTNMGQSKPTREDEGQFVKVLHEERQKFMDLAKETVGKDDEIAKLRAELAAITAKGPTTGPTESPEHKAEREAKEKLAREEGEKSKGNLDQRSEEKDINKRVAGETGPDKNEKGDLKQAAPTSGTTTKAFPQTGNKLT